MLSALPVLLAALATEPARGLHPLRTLIYHINYGVSTRIESRGPVGGQTSLTMHEPAVVPGAGQDVQVVRTTNFGTLRVDVITIKAGVLVVDAQLEGSERSQPPLRVAVFPSGLLTYDQSRQLSPEARLLLPLLSGQFFGDREPDQGDQWSVPWLAPSKGETHYTVAAIDGDRISLRVEGSGTQGAITRQDTATMTYEMRRLDPIRYEYEGVDRDASTVAAYRIDHIALEAELVSDTFATAP